MRGFWVKKNQMKKRTPTDWQNEILEGKEIESTGIFKNQKNKTVKEETENKENEQDPTEAIIFMICGIVGIIAAIYIFTR